MTVQKVVLAVWFLFLLNTACAQEIGNSTASAVGHALDFSQTVLPITDLKFIGVGFKGWLGTGFCLDPQCRFIGTNYHVAEKARPKRIKGQKVVKLYVATGPNDEDATVNPSVASGPSRFALVRDLAIFELSHPLRNYHGLSYNLAALENGQEVDIYAYPKESISPLRSLFHFHGTFKGETTTGLLAFDYNVSAGEEIRGGASGGIVVDSKTQQIVGVLEGIAQDGEPIAVAVPVASLADFVAKVKPCLVETIFPPVREIPAVSSDFYPKFVSSPAGVLERRPEESRDVKALRSKAQHLTDGMRNFIAVQTFSWGSGDKPPAAAAAYEVRVLDGFQSFREYPDGKKYLHDAPLADLNRDISTGDQWARLPEMIGTELGLKIHETADIVTDNRRFKVFQYWADREDALPECQFLTIADFDFFKIKKVSNNVCYGEVWTDEDLNIVRMSLHLELSGKWQRYQTVVTYGWLTKDDTPRLVPLTIYAQAEYNKQTYWCRGSFLNYRVFSSRTRMLAGRSGPADAQPE